MKSFDKDKLKKQIVSGGIYIALAAAVVTVTLNGVNNIIGSSEDYEIPEIKLDLPESSNYELFEDTTGETGLNDIIFRDNTPELSDSDIAEIKSEINNITEDNSAVIPNDEIGSIQQSGSSAEGIPSDVVAEDVADSLLSDETEVSGEPDDVEYPTEPDPISYESYAKPAEGYVDKEFSDDDLLYSVTMGDYRTHNGIDITGDPGSTVKAINAGNIIDIYKDDFYGHTIKIDHGNGIVAYYMNLSETLPAGISKGVKVKYGQVIGGIGNTAAVESAEVSHLHLSITVNGEFIDPRELLRGEY